MSEGKGIKINTKHSLDRPDLDAFDDFLNGHFDLDGVKADWENPISVKVIFNALERREFIYEHLKAAHKHGIQHERKRVRELESALLEAWGMSMVYAPKDNWIPNKDAAPWKNFSVSRMELDSELDGDMTVYSGKTARTFQLKHKDLIEKIKASK